MRFCVTTDTMLWLIYIVGDGFGYPLGIRIPNLMATLYYSEHVHIAQTRTQIPTPYFCVRYESESKSVPESVAM